MISKAIWSVIYLPSSGAEAPSATCLTRMVDDILHTLSTKFDRVYARGGRPSVASPNRCSLAVGVPEVRKSTLAAAAAVRSMDQPTRPPAVVVEDPAGDMLPLLEMTMCFSNVGQPLPTGWKTLQSGT